MDGSTKEGSGKYWSELALTEKVERMRTVVKMQGREIGELKDMVRNLRNHSHIGDTLVIKWDSRDRKFHIGRPLTPGKEYF